jgi:signal transduction histidine kinase
VTGTLAKADIVVVDDTPANLQVLASMLAERGYKVRPSTSGRIALQSIRLAPPDLILLDIRMPEMDGYQVCEELKLDEKLRDIPVLFISALHETDNKVRAFRVGAVDYITKPFQFEEVVARVETQLELYWQKQEIKRLREEDRLYYEKLSQMKDAVVRTASHDLKNPLCLVLGAAHLLVEHVAPDDEEGQRLVSMIQRGTNRMEMLITDLLDLARIETGLALNMQILPLNDFLRINLEDFSQQAQNKNITLRFSPLHKDISLAYDPNRLSQVLHNLLSNAIKYTREGGWVELATEVSDNVVRIHISDSGLGIPAEDIPHLFEKFHRVDMPEHMAIEGTGLGLSIVESIVKQHGGRIKVQSELGVGSTFSILLPIRL